MTSESRMLSDLVPIEVKDLDELELAHAEVRRRIVPWLAQAVVRALFNAGVPREQIEELACEMAQRAYPLVLQAFKKRADAIAAELRDDAANDDDGPTSTGMLH